MTVYIEIPYQDPVALFDKVKSHDWPMLLHSADTGVACVSEANRFSYIVFAPVEKFILQDGCWLSHADRRLQQDPFTELAQFFRGDDFTVLAELPPFQGGLMGYFSYDLCQYLENIPLPSLDYTEFPELALGLYDVVVSFDHQQKKAWVVSSGYPVRGTLQEAHAKKRLKEIVNCLSDESCSQSVVAIEDVANLQSNFSRQAYEGIVEKSRQYILEGDIFEVNVSQCFSAKVSKELDGFALYRQLAQHNPAPFSAYLKLDEYEIISASPERFISVNDLQVKTQPIKGTIKRSQDVAQDRILAEQLAVSQKDRAENIMIVDLMRNDLSRVCEHDSVQVKQLCKVQSFATVHHLVSKIEGQLPPNKTVFDLLRVCFPGGSITGAPKIRAMQIISELEPNRRSVYCGSLVWINFQQDMDSSIVIRTFLRNQARLTFQAGGAVVLASDPEVEYEETLLKAKALKETLEEQLDGCYH